MSRAPPGNAPLPESQPSLDFVTYTGRETAEERRASKQRIRKHVSLVQHKRSKNVIRPFDVPPWQVNEYDPPESSRNTFQAQTPRSSCSSSKPEARPADDSRHDPSSGPSSSSTPSEGRSDGQTHHHANEDTSIYPFNLPFNPHSPPLSLLRLPGSSQADPFWTFPIDFSPIFPHIMSHYIQILAIPNLDLDGPSQSGLLRSHWFPLAMSSPASMYGLLLMSAAHYHAVHVKASSPSSTTSLSPSPSSQSGPTSPIHNSTLLALKQLAIRAVDAAIRSNDPQRAVSNSTIGAVAKLAAFEAVFGDKNALRQHLLGLGRMMQVRSEAEARGELEPLDGFLARLVQWVDLNAAFWVGEERVLGGTKGLDGGRRLVGDEPDPRAFTGMDIVRGSRVFEIDGGG